ncbi:Protein of unknown function [Friedmanniella luteola]|uniref:DUF3017 domain-containing protein n=1 Tax=Friedmanniella luteola TaxID=546871 RepID=A0A1H1YRE5_9ACTN|nr:DUF3017 domain-containing protein [Friedmanniella luteola]SDT23859.1 Protein of unknown function [Friedmanniella luteola]
MARGGAGAAPQQRPWPLLVVVAGVALGLLVSVLGEATWRLGSVLVGLALLVGAVERLVLSDRAAGLLQVRGKGFDVAVLALFGLAVVALALVVPPGR